MNPNRVRASSPATQSPARGKKLDPAIARQICSLVEEGLGYDSALAFLGVDTVKFWSWINKGDRYWKGNCQPAKWAPYGNFVMSLRKATATYVLERTRGLKSKTWYRDLNILERKDRKNWSRREPQGGSIDSYDPDERFL